MQEKLFALDIGTRSVVGIIIEKEDEQYCVTDILSIEHTERAMLDGQIHDVLAVSKVISQIKEKMEKKHGTLATVSVAAAGRALKTERASVSVHIEGKPMMNQEDILHLELSAVQLAQSTVAESFQATQSFDYYCVGYSVLYYRLDGIEIGSLIDQNGTEASVEIIATFLPKVVVDSLISALKRSGLQMQALTLEPIAAINVLIPPSMRRLNVALVDIGAGTSDIALTDLGTVIAYGMVPTAGDEVTEAISDHLLLDFPLAEQAKRQMSIQDKIKVKDILGFEEEVETSAIIKQIMPALDNLAVQISEEILNLNSQKEPKAIMLVGGGSLTPELPKLLANKLNLPANRVAVRDVSAIQSVTIADEIPKGPELVTPIGIALAAQKNPVQYVSVTVNDVPVRLFDMKQLTVGDCLLASGIKVNKLYGKPGLALMVEVNGQSITVPGQHGKPPILLLNGEPASLKDEVHADDTIYVERGEDGGQHKVQIKDLIDDIPRKTVIINQTKYVIEAVIKKNNQITSPAEYVEDHDEIICRLPETVENLITALGLTSLLHHIQPFTIYLNDKAYSLDSFSGLLKKNGLDAKRSASIEDGDVIQLTKALQPTVRELADSLNLELHYALPVTFNGKPLVLKKRRLELSKDNQVLQDKDYITNGDRLRLIHKTEQPFIFQDLFRHIDIDLPKHSARPFILMKNNQETTFHETLNPGDRLAIMWPAASDAAK
ncbi:cell division FtsA domain-containing protein [Bacillus sp. 1P06AnD]|uniref:cell division FtsA domain-containing protein n=1 Tax=Bacillus sp. 1P06AnD TaxID=3132208 RepID=UPI00399EEAF0